MTNFEIKKTKLETKKKKGNNQTNRNLFEGQKSRNLKGKFLEK